MTLEALARSFLGRLEADEERLLAWGLVDGGFSEEELTERATSFLEEYDEFEVTASELLADLRRRALILDLNVAHRRIFRTRMAESIRLLTRLRQWFHGSPWQLAPSLVADYRLSVRPREYPARSVPSEDVTKLVGDEKLGEAGTIRVIRALLEPAGEPPWRLAHFQVRSLRVMLRDLASGSSRGMIVGVPTGTGKTLAFYLPAFAHLSRLIDAQRRWTKALAIYPRNELLKDQFLETYRQARRVDGVLPRKLIIGAFFGDTPWGPNSAAVERLWERHETGFVCPFLSCPACGGVLVWTTRDLNRQLPIQRLTCARPNCGKVVDGSEVLFTREAMKSTPPDILFTTTETLNRQLSNTKYGHVFGVGATRPPHLVLLDEVHTYTGVHGAQVAYLLRRWRRAVGGRVHFTGLSATLRNAGEFFARLVGLNAAAVEEIAQRDDLESEGMEYQLALRGDPVSGASLLSTSIQAAMLLERTLDPADSDKSGGLYGRRVFAFTDDLDVTNRLFHTLQDAEGLDSRGRPLAWKGPLAFLRRHDADDAADRLLTGQSWLLCERIGHDLSRPLRVARTMSLDPGVERDADVVVATAALEVGYNDPAVGAVLQHKAPRDMASFLQRKGRAGRSRLMRPWTVVILSDYGADRLAYQAYDLLFDPILSERVLPLENRYILKMQAVYAFLDWVADSLRRANLAPGAVWSDFSGPASGDWAEPVRERQQHAELLVRQVLESDVSLEALRIYLSSALGVSEEEAQALLWEPPRALVPAVLPTLQRRLHSNWARVPARPGEPAGDYQVPDSPLPDFIPRNLFSDLNLPEVLVETPPARQGAKPRVEPMAIAHAIKEFAPGRVSRRFGVEHSRMSHWFAPPGRGGEQVLSVESYCADFEEAGEFQYTDGSHVVNVACVRPTILKPVAPPEDIQTTSNAFPDWRTQIGPADEGRALDLPQRSPWEELIAEARYFTHNQRSFIEVRRFAVGARADLKVRRVGSVETYVRFTRGDDARPAAVGFSQTVDGVVFRYRPPTHSVVPGDDPSSAKVLTFRTAFFQHLVQTDSRLDGLANSFQRDWLAQVFLSMLTSRALLSQRSLQAELASLMPDEAGAEMAHALEVIFQTLAVDEPDEDEDEEEGGAHHEGHRQPAHERLRALCQTQIVSEALRDLARALWESPSDEWERWAALRFKTTLGGALLEACIQLCPQFGAQDFLLDVTPGPRPVGADPAPDGLEEIWITESMSGGGGVIEEVVRQYTGDPRNFFRLVETALGPSDFEIVDSEITRVLEALASDPDLATAAAARRAARTHDSLRQAGEQFRRSLVARGIFANHPVVTALNARVLRAGSSPATDALLLEFIRLWRQEEERLGIEIDARVFAFVASSTDRLDQALAAAGHAPVGDPTWRFRTIYGLLWPRGNAIRIRNLASYNRFARLPYGDRELVLDVLRPVEIRVALTDPDWRALCREALAAGSTVVLRAGPVAQGELKLAVLDLSAEPLDIGFLHLFPCVEGVVRAGGGFEVKLRLSEAHQ